MKVEVGRSRTAKGRRNVKRKNVAKGANATAKNPSIKHDPSKKGKGCNCGSASQIINYF